MSHCKKIIFFSFSVLFVYDVTLPMKFIPANSTGKNPTKFSYTHAQILPYNFSDAIIRFTAVRDPWWQYSFFSLASLFLFHFIFLIYFNALLFRFEIRCAYFSTQNNLKNSHTSSYSCPHPQFDLNVGWLVICLTVLFS